MTSFSISLASARGEETLRVGSSQWTRKEKKRQKVPSTPGARAPGPPRPPPPPPPRAPCGGQLEAGRRRRSRRRRTGIGGTGRGSRGVEPRPAGGGGAEGKGEKEKKVEKGMDEEEARGRDGGRRKSALSFLLPALASLSLTLLAASSSSRDSSLRHPRSKPSGSARSERGIGGKRERGGKKVWFCKGRWKKKDDGK